MRDIKAISPWKLVWLASYPKSGNTWFRIFLTNYLQNKEKPAILHELERSPIASCRNSFDRLYGIDSVDLDFSEIDRRRPALYAEWQKNQDTLFHKVHDAYTYLPDGQPLLGDHDGQAALYFIRNPLDIAVSLAHHSGTDDFDKIIAQMNCDQFSFCEKENNFSIQLRQKLLSWHNHVLSWFESSVPKLILRYEDMLNDTFNTFRQAICFLKLPDDEKRIQRAINFSTFDILQEQEKNMGFPEKPPRAKNFFRQGQAGKYIEALTQTQIESITHHHKKVMEQFHYV